MSYSNSGNKYTPPARRAPTGQSTVSGAPVDPAIISSQLAKPSTEKSKGAAVPSTTKPTKSEVATPPTTTESSFAVSPESKPAVSITPASASRTASPQVRPEARTERPPNATATVERDVAHAFKSFASKERKNVDQLRTAKARNDKEFKINDLKKFADSFKLNTPVPSDLISIIAKDPAKQKAIQEKAKHNAEEAKANLPTAAKITTPASESKQAQRPAPAVHGTSPSTNNSNRQNANSRNQNFPNHYNPQQPFRNERPQPGPQGVPPQQIRQQGPGNLSQRLKPYENKPPQMNPIPVFHQDVRQPPTGPANPVDNFSRRSSGVASAQGTRPFNVTAKEFQPNVNATTFTPGPNPSTGSSPGSSAIVAVDPQPAAPIIRSLLRRKPVEDTERPDITEAFNAMKTIRSHQVPAGRDAQWKATGGLKPAYDTPPVWRIAAHDELPNSEIHITYNKYFDQKPFSSSMSPTNNSHAVPQVPHQHQLPFHLQQGVHNMGPRGSPRQPPMNMHPNQHLHGPTPSFNGGGDDHRMMVSHSAQSFASPRLGNVAMYPSPMGQQAQLAYNPQMAPYPQGAPPMQGGYRSMSNSHQFVPQQPQVGPIMMQNPANGFMTSQGMAPGPPMMYPQGGQGQFMPPNNGHQPPMPGLNGYPSPGRSAPMMINQGSQQGHQQPIYGMNPGLSPGPQYGAPIYAQQGPNQQSKSHTS